jgi:hypothetical protein
MLKKGLPTSPAVARNVELPEKNKTEIVAVVAGILVNHVKCSLPFVLLVERKRQSHSNLPVTNQCIAVTVINLAHATIGKSFQNETFLGSDSWKGFFLYSHSPYQTPMPRWAQTIMKIAIFLSKIMSQSKR